MIFKKDKYYISLQDMNDHRFNGDIIKAKKIDGIGRTMWYFSKKDKGDLISTYSEAQFREASPQEIAWHLKDPTVNINITTMPEQPVVNNTYNLW